MIKMKLPKGVQRQVRKSGRVRYYYQEGRNTPHEGPRTRLPDDPHSPEFWAALNLARGITPATPKPPPEKDKTIEMMVSAYMVSPRFQRLADSTRREYTRYLTMLQTELGNEEPTALEPHHVATIRDNLGAETPGKANAMVAIIGALFAWGRELGWCKINPAEGITKLDSEEYQPWPEWALQAYPTVFPGELVRLSDLALYTGQRISDTIKMHRRDVSDGVLYVKQKKTGKELWLPLHPALKPVLQEPEWLAPKPQGGQWTEDQFHAAWGRAMKDKRGNKRPAAVIREAGLVYHGLRKNATVHLAEVGCTTHEIASITGMSLHIIEHYTKAVRQKTLAVNAMKKVTENAGPK
jgi:integrase